MTVEILKIVQAALVETDAKRARSKQIEIGASSVGGCSRKAWHIINQTTKTNFQTEKLPAIIGTAMHAAVAEALREYDVFGGEFEIEFPLEIPELKGNCDLYVAATKSIWDFKTVTLQSITKKNWLDKQKKMQVNLYGYMKNQRDPGSVEKVGLIAIPRDGKFSQMVAWEDDYDEALALEGLEWLRNVRDANEPPAPQKYQNFCASYCEYFDPSGDVGCPGL